MVDDGSTDASLPILRRWRDSGRLGAMTLVEQPAAGAVAALNRALGCAQGDLVVQLDGDATVETPGWLERMVALLESEPRVGVVGATTAASTPSGSICSPRTACTTAARGLRNRAGSGRCTRA